VVFAKKDSLDCEAKYQQWEDFFNEYAMITIADNAPEIIGGLKEVQKQLVYPESGKQNFVDGRVYVQMIIDIKGDPKCVRIIKRLQEDFDQAAIDVLRKIKFKPATQRGKPMEMPFVLPVEFNIQKPNKQ